MISSETRPLGSGSESFGTVVSPPDSKPSLASSEASLVLIYPSSSDIGRRYVLNTGPTTIGRTSTNPIANPDDSVSRAHARIDCSPGGKYTVTDLNSTNGTFVNDVRVKSKHLRDGDYLRVGSCIYRFLAGGNVEAQYHEEIYRLTVLDPLTGVHNRRYMHEMLEREVARAVRHARPLAVALFDIDHFKAINDRFGHVCGDRALCEVTRRVRGLIRTEEVFSRYGGEEFVVILTETNLEAGRAFGERIREAIAAEPFAFDGTAHRVTVSVGVSTTTAPGPHTPDELLRRADELMYASKRGGRNRVSV
jgi:two-component system cell cycle response regulator